LLRERHDLPRPVVVEYADQCRGTAAWILDEGERGTIPIQCPACGLWLVGTIQKQRKGMIFSTGDMSGDKKLWVDLPPHVAPVEGPT
jgi:hypothetical protein